MASRGAIDLSFRADLSNLTKQLAKMPETTEKEAKAMVKALEKQFKSAEKAAERAAKSAGNAWQKSGKRVRGAAADTKRVTEEMDQLSHRAGDADSALKGVGGALGLVSPEAEAVFQTIGELGGGLEGMIRTLKAGVGPLGLVAAAVAAGAFAWKHYSEELEEAEQKAKDMAQAAEDMAKAVNAFKATEARIELEHLVATGQEEIETLQLAQAADKARNAMRDISGPAITKLTEAQTKYNEAVTREAKLSTDSRAIVSGAHAEAVKEAETAAIILNRRQDQVDRLTDKEANLAAMVFETGQANAKSGKATKKASKDQKDAIEELIEATNRLIPDDRSKVQILADQMATLQVESGKSAAAAGRLAPSIAQIQNAMDKIKIDEFNTELKELQIEQDKWIEKTRAAGLSFAESGTSVEKGKELLKELKTASEQSAEAFTKMQPAIQGVQDRLDNISVEQAQAKLGALANQINSIGGNFMGAMQNIASLNLNDAIKDGQKAMEFFDKKAEGLNEEIDQINQMISETTSESAKKQLEAEKELLEGRLAANEEARAKEEQIQNESIAKAFRLQQGVQVASVVMNTATAIMQAWAQLGPIAAPFATAGITALGATQIALIQQQEPPTLHMGGMIRPDEKMVKARIGEGMLTAQGVNAIGGEAGLNAANAGGNMPTRIVVQQVYKHKVLDTVLSDSIARGGPIGTALNKRTPRGRRNPHRRAS